jgi:hypothetical protein
MVRCLVCARTLLSQNPDKIVFNDKEDYKVLFPTQWDRYMKNTANKLKGAFYEHSGNIIIFLNDSQYIGNA